MEFLKASAVVLAAVASATIGVPKAQASSVIDLTGAGSSATVNGAIMQQIDPQPTGTGYIDSFVRLQSPGNADTENGYNTDARGWVFNQFDANSSPQFTRSLLLDDVGTATIGDTVYRQFLLDINEPNGSTKHGHGQNAWYEQDSLVSLDSVRIYLGTAGDNLSLLPDFLGRLVWTMDGLCNGVTLKLNDLNSGSGQGDYLLSVPDSLFAAKADADHQYVYLYSSFGCLTGASAQGGFEEWATLQGQTPAVPLPPAAYSALTTMGVLGLFATRRRISKLLRD